VTYTPLLGQTQLLIQFQENENAYMVNATWDDAPHLNEKMKKEALAAYPDYEIDARSKGVPMMGEGLIFPISDEEIMIDPFEMPRHWPRICGVDFGMSHYGAGVWMAWDRDTDTVYIYDCYKKKGESSVYHAAAIKARGDWIPVAWPHDGLNREKSGGTVLVDQYRAHGTRMLGMSARYKKDKGGGQPQEPIIEAMLERMRTGRLKVFRNCGPWLEERRTFHRVDGLIINKREDVIKASLYGLMMIRYAQTQTTRTVHTPSFAGITSRVA